MNKQQAMEEIEFIKRLLENTGKEIVKSGWNFVWIGCLMFLGPVMNFILWNLCGFNRTFKWFWLQKMEFYCVLHNQVVFAFLVFSIIIAVGIVSYLIYRKTINGKTVNTLENQIWQIWIWAITFTIIINSIGFENSAGKLRINLSLAWGETGMNIAILIAVIATGVLTNQKFFYKFAVMILSLGILFKALPSSITTIILRDAVNILLPITGTGVYFLVQRHKELKVGETDGVE